MEKLKSKIYYSLVVGISKNKGIGNKGTLPWGYLSKDMSHFKTITSSVFNENESKVKYLSSLSNFKFNSMLKELKEIDEKKNKMNIVVMGRSTWESIPVPKRPLPGRINIVLSRSEEFHNKQPNITNSFYCVKDLESFFLLAESLQSEGILNEVFVIGGTQIFSDFLNEYPTQCKLIFLTHIEKEFESDTFFEIPQEFETIFVSKTFHDTKINACYDFRLLLNPICLRMRENIQSLDQLINPFYLTQHPIHQEYQYLEAINELIETGLNKGDRTGVGTISKFGYSMRYDCSETFPLLTTKDTFWRGIVEELLWFIKGDTNAKHLQEKKVHIWDGNATKEFLEKQGIFDREEGDLGPVYGFQWRHFGAEYKTMHENYEGEGVDQLLDIIKRIKEEPTSRRLIMCAWNPKDLKLMALPPCHVMCQFFVDKNNRLSLQMYQRSADMGLGVPFNIASYALLLRMVAQVTGLLPGEFIHTIGDAHVYLNHIAALKEQLKRTPRPFPVLKINPEIKDIESFKFSDFTLVGYNPYKKIKMDMAV
jgi:dihydrofolate reductase/thymidylate synthase